VLGQGLVRVLVPEQGLEPALVLVLARVLGLHRQPLSS